VRSRGGIPLDLEVQEYYTQRLTGAPASTITPCCGGGAAGADAAGSGAVPSCGPRGVEASTTPSFGCGDPTASAGLVPGETVLDLGSGAGLDAFRAAHLVGPGGRVIGVDMTPAMLERAREGARRLGLDHVEFREGLIEALPVADASVDLVISNCVINLSLDKPAVFREVERVLRPGGRVRVSDILVHGGHERAPTVDGWCGCVDGAVTAEAYALDARRAGLIDVAIAPDPPGVPRGATYAATITGRKAAVAPADAVATDAGEALLSAAGLPTAGWRSGATERLALVEGGVLLGIVAIERHGGEALLRSLAVAPAARGRGVGGALLASAVRAARRDGAQRVYALTTTIPAWLARRGFGEVARERVPAALHASAELQGACPDTARVFVLDVTGGSGGAHA
jgi:arsenite methyltransferase